MVIKAREAQKEKSWKEKGYTYDAAKKFFWWELGHVTEYPVYISATWEDSVQDYISAIGRLNRIRSAMQYYWQLNDVVFNKSNEGFSVRSRSKEKRMRYTAGKRPIRTLRVTLNSNSTIICCRQTNMANIIKRIC